MKAMLHFIEAANNIENLIKDSLKKDSRHFQEWFIEGILNTDLGQRWSDGPDTWLDILAHGQRTVEEALQEMMENQRWCQGEGCWSLSGEQCEHDCCSRCCDEPCVQHDFQWLL